MFISPFETFRVIILSIDYEITRGVLLKFHYHLLINPASGGGKGTIVADKIIQLLKNNQYFFSTYYTEYANHEIEYLNELVDQYLTSWGKKENLSEPFFHLLIVIGGDGTLHQVVEALHLLNKEIPVAFIPAGSGNDFARGFGISREPVKAFWQIIKAQEPKNINILAYHEQASDKKGIILNNLGIGIDGAIVHQANTTASKQKLSKYKLGAFVYIVSALKILFQQKGFPVLIEANGKEYNFKKAFLCTTTTHPYFGGGVAIAPTANSSVVNFDFILVERHLLLKVLGLLFLLPFKKHDKAKSFIQINTTKLRIISTTAQFGQVDGEVILPNAFDYVITPTKQKLWY